ncbi:uncharacterized protein TRIADDRAFT_25061 [Trichoplax adhaerens]|uniref:GBD/FH3 domain-containing protein n=1 Tax=Trichoplax adhaerens TaxID=10228 RepID=B3RYM2_TRIAD|nr:hypothetical protein TRIADDRAFT_25061 [Trichoplax adhaerens]EDV24621.1 hypothetical protein TRIADDRAFT_25061 [Trichoplax adhaerens]|eukprot:XP_002112511.1 hypothetical protein TRIADDRAFT_25061 [Trichoplax adhaerens]
MASTKWGSALKKAAAESRAQELTSGINLAGLDTATPELCLKLIRQPSVQNFTALKNFLSRCQQTWMIQFLEIEGLNVILEVLEILCDRGISSVIDAFIQLECVNCVKAIMNSSAGINYIINHRESSRMLVKAFDSGSVMVKKQVVELLSAVSVYSDEGYDMVLDSLQTFKEEYQEKSRFSAIVDELREAEVISYQVAVLALINCLIIAAADFDQRIMIRNEFISLGLLDVLTKLR